MTPANQEAYKEFGTVLGKMRCPCLWAGCPMYGRRDIYPTDVSLQKIDGSDLFVLASYFGDSCP